MRSKTTRSILLGALTVLVSATAGAQRYEPLRVRWPNMNPATLPPAWAVSAEGDLLAGLVHQDGARVGSYDLSLAEPPAPGTFPDVSTLVRTGPGGVLRYARDLMPPSESDVDDVREIVPLPDGRFVTAEERGPHGAPRPVLAMRDAAGSALWSVGALDDLRETYFRPYADARGDVYVQIDHYISRRPERLQLAGGAGFRMAGHGWHQGVARVDGRTGAVLWVRYVARGESATLFRPDGSFLVVHGAAGGTAVDAWDADGRRVSTLTLPRPEEGAESSDYALVGDGVLAELRRPFRVVERLPGGGERFERLPSVLTAFDLRGGAALWTRELPPGDRVRLARGGRDTLWVLIDHARVQGTVGRGGGARWLAGAARIEGYDASGALVAGQDFTMAGRQMFDTRLQVAGVGLLFDGKSVALRDGAGEPEIFAMLLPGGAQSAQVTATTVLAGGDGSTARSDVTARVPPPQLSPLTPDAEGGP